LIFDKNYAIKAFLNQEEIMKLSKIGSGINRIVLACSFFWTIGFAQPPAIQWTKTYGGGGIDKGYSVQQTADNGYIIAGVTYSFGAGSADIWLLKTDANGDTLWSNTIGGSGGEQAQSIQQTSDGGYIITGVTSSFGAGQEDIWLVKTDADGDTVWTRTFGGSDYDGGFSVRQAADGGYIISGRIWAFGSNRYDIWLTKTDSIGNTQWTKTFGGFDDDSGNSVQRTSDGGYIVAGVLSFDVFLIKTGGNGDTLWTKAIGGNSPDGGNSIQQTSDGGYIIAGFTRSFGNGNGDVWLVKTDANGDTVWTKTFGGSLLDNAFSIQQTSDGGYILSGATNSFGAGGVDIWLIRTDANGDTLWSQTFGGSSGDYGYSIQQTNDGGYIATGEITPVGAGSADVWLIKLAPDVTKIDKTPQPVIDDYKLYQNYPNPFNPTTRIQYVIGSRQFVSLKIFNLLGGEIVALINEEKPAGEYTVEFDAGSLSSGIYFYQLQAGNFSRVRKMILMR
ncbi:MAG: T9SS type A sorting domain-containing protein, partial [Candidatus Bathyarchaeota archaeon]